jgi:hypothetical protein
VRNIFFILSAACVLAVGFIAWYRWDTSRNRGHKWGYWGEFNTVSNSLARLPGVTISGAYCNQDVSLEEFGFDILTSQKQKIHVDFDENDPARRLSGDDLRAALLKRIREQSSDR